MSRLLTICASLISEIKAGDGNGYFQMICKTYLSLKFEDKRTPTNRVDLLQRYQTFAEKVRLLRKALSVRFPAGFRQLQFRHQEEPKHWEMFSCAKSIQ